MKVQIKDTKNAITSFNGENSGTYMKGDEHEGALDEAIVKLGNGKGFMYMSTLHRLGYKVESIETGEIIQ